MEEAMEETIERQVRRSLARADRFDNYRQLTARFDSVGACGHPIRKGDLIGYSPRAKTCRCAACWSRWCDENAAAAADEAFMAGQAGQEGGW